MGSKKFLDFNDDVVLQMDVEPDGAIHIHEGLGFGVGIEREQLAEAVLWLAEQLDENEKERLIHALGGDYA